MNDSYDLVIIGGGSTGLMAAGFAVQLGARVALVETPKGKISYEAIGQLTPSLNKGIMYHTAVLTLISRRAFCTCTKRSSHLWSGGVARAVTVSKLTPLTETPYIDTKGGITNE